MDRPRLAFTYLLFVGVPLLGLVGILRAGRGLSAPVAISGDWSLQADASPLASDSCGAEWTQLAQPALSISQSGTEIVVTLNSIDGHPITLTGTIQEGRLHAAGAPAGYCAAPHTLFWDGAVTGPGTQRTITGALGVANCSGCATVEFRANRMLPTREGIR
jgi:hypothetical protein